MELATYCERKTTTKQNLTQKQPTRLINQNGNINL